MQKATKRYKIRELTYIDNNKERYIELQKNMVNFTL